MNNSEQSRYRNICFTLNNYSETDLYALSTFKHNSYYVIGKEVAPTTGTPHLQGYIEFKKQVTHKSLKKLCPRMNFERRYENSSPEAAATYCKKDGNFIEGGEISKQGRRTDLEEVARTVAENKSIRKIALEHPESYIKYHTGIEKLRDLIHFKPRDKAPDVYWLWGKSGKGKTYYGVSKHPGDHYIKNSSKWWDGYEQQTAVIIDDYDHGHSLDFRELCRLLQEYECRIEAKGRMLQFNSPVIYITSEFPPEHFFGLTDNMKTQIIRRLKEVIHLE